MKSLPSRIVGALYEDLEDRPVMSVALDEMSGDEVEEMCHAWLEIVCRELVRKK